MVIYKIYKHSAIDFFDGKNVYSISDSGMEERPYGFATEGHRIANGMKSLYSFHFEETEEMVFDHLFYKNGFINFYNVKIIVIDSANKIPSTTNTDIDYVLLRNSPKVVMDDIYYTLKYKKIIFDNSNKSWQVKKWKEQCERLGIEYFDIAMEGAFVLNLEQQHY